MAGVGIDVGCGAKKRSGYVGLDYAPGSGVAWEIHGRQLLEHKQRYPERTMLWNMGRARSDLAVHFAGLDRRLGLRRGPGDFDAVYKREELKDLGLYGWACRALIPDAAVLYEELDRHADRA